MKAPTILVVEDNTVTRKMVHTALAAEGYHVLEAADARTGLELVRKAAPDLILQDLLLPDLDGFELVRRLRAEPGLSDVPIIAVSGFLSRLESARTFAAGFTDFLSKPVAPSRLLETVRLYLPPSGAESDTAGRGRGILLVDDDPVQLKLGALHLTRRGFRVTTAGDGLEALEKARQTRPDAILSDILMPHFDGYQLCLAVRQDPELSRLPVVLTSANYVSEPDRRLGEQVGASAMTLRAPDLSEAINALLTSLDTKLAPAPSAPTAALEQERLHRVVRQLEHQVAMNINLVQRTSLQSTILSMLAHLSDSLAKPLDAQAAAREVMGSLLDSGGLSSGALYLVGADGQLRLEVPMGFEVVAADEAQRAFGHPELFERTLEAGRDVVVPSETVPEETTRDFLARARVASAVMVPLFSGGKRVGVLLVGSARRDLSQQDWLAFIHTAATQLSQAVALTRVVSELAASEKRYRSLFDRVPIGLFRATQGGRILDANPALVRMAGFPDRESFLAANLADLYVHPEDRRRLEAAEGEVHRFEAELRRYDGTTMWARINAQVIQEEGRTLYEGSVEDVTEHKQLQEQLIQAEKLATLGELIAGIAHELNNPLSAMVGHAQLLLMRCEDPSLTARLDKILEAARRSTRIVRNFLTFARRHHPERVPTSVNELVTRTVDLLAYQFRVANVKVETSLASGLPSVSADPHQIQQVLLNLFNNACQAMTGAGREGTLRITTGFDGERGRVTLSVADDGPGIAPMHLPRIFEPFFTTKSAGEGTGLGLAIAQGIVREHEGTLDVESAPGRGTAFVVTLPVSETLPPAPAGAEARGIPQGLRVLVVDDEASLREVTVEALRSQGCRVEVAASGLEALEILGRTPVDVVILDLRMPGASGEEVWSEIGRRYPTLAPRAVFCTGDVMREEVRAFLASTGCQTVTKPFELPSLFDAVARAASV